MRSALFLALLPILALSQLPAQSPAPHPENLGTVTGHITCSDTQRPARLAEIHLISVRNPPPFDGYEYKTAAVGMEYKTPTVGMVAHGPTGHTDLTGDYTIPEVEPGQYYLRVDLPGYATPISQFSVDDLKSPEPEVQQRIQSELQLVTVAPNSTVQADATIPRGASISGTVTFEDGSPAIAIAIVLLRRDANGQLDAVRLGANISTNGRGQFGIESLSPGEYAIETELTTFTRGREPSVRNGTMKFTPGEYAISFIPIYSGNVFRQKDASLVKVDAGQEAAADISIPLSRLHEVSGTLLSKDSHPINAGQIELLDPDTQERIVAGWAGDEGAFHLRHVPEGSYILKVTGASDLGPLEAHAAPNFPTATVIDRRTLRTYGTLEQPLTVQTDVQSLILTVPNKPAATPAQ